MPVIIEFSRCIGTYSSAKFELLKYTEDSKTKYVILMAVTATCSFWCKQPTGYVALLSLVLLFIFSSSLHHRFDIKSVLVFSLTCMLVMAVFIIPMLINDSISDWWIQCIQVSTSFLMKRIPGPELGMIERLTYFVYNLIRMLLPITCFKDPCLVIWSVIPIISVLVVVIYGLRLMGQSLKSQGKPISKADFSLFSYAVFCCASWSQYYPVPTINHIYWGGIPIVGIFAIEIYLLIKRAVKPKYGQFIGIISFGILFLLSSFNIYRNVQDGIMTIQRNQYKVVCQEYPFLDGIKFTYEQSLFYSDMNDTLVELKKEYPDRDILNISRMNYESCYMEHNIGQLYSLYGAGVYPDYADKWNTYIEETKPIIISDTNSSELKMDQYVLYKTLDGNQEADNHLAGELPFGIYIYGGE